MTDATNEANTGDNTTTNLEQTTVVEPVTNEQPVANGEGSNGDATEATKEDATAEQPGDVAAFKRAALGNGVTQVGNAMDTMHGKINDTRPRFK